MSTPDPLVATVDRRAAGHGEVPVDLPDPSTADHGALADLLRSMTGEATRLKALLARRGPDRERGAAPGDCAADPGTVWRAAVLDVCAAHRVAAIAAGDAADRGEDDAFGSLAALCTHLMGWLTWCGRLPFATPAELPDGEPTLPYGYATRGGEPARMAAIAFTEVLAARRWPPARRGAAEGGHARAR